MIFRKKLHLSRNVVAVKETETLAEKRDFLKRTKKNETVASPSSIGRNDNLVDQRDKFHKIWKGTKLELNRKWMNLTRTLRDRASFDIFSQKNKCLKWTADFDSHSISFFREGKRNGGLNSFKSKVVLSPKCRWRDLTSCYFAVGFDIILFQRNCL